MVAPTGLIAPEGAIGVSLRTPVAPAGHVHLTYVLLDRVELGGQVFFRAGKSGGGGGGTLRIQALRRERSALTGFAELYATDGGKVVVGGAAFSRCVDGVACRALVSVSAATLHHTAGTSFPLVGGAAFAYGRRYQAVGEAIGTISAGEPIGTGYVGGRLLYGQLAFDAGVMAASGELGVCRLSCGEGVSVVTIGPALAVSIRN